MERLAFLARAGQPGLLGHRCVRGGRGWHTLPQKELLTREGSSRWVWGGSGRGGGAPLAAVSHPGPLTATYTPWTGLHLGTLPEASQPQSSMEVTVVVPQAGSRKEWHLSLFRKALRQNGQTTPVSG